MSKMSNTLPPQLEPPGAGLPKPILFVAKRLFALKRCFGSREKFLAEFKAEKEHIRQLVADCPLDQRSERALIPRLRGLEDSSRYWSVWMTLEHLQITNSLFAQVITSLSKGHVPQKKANTADVKPSPDVKFEVEAAYEHSCEQILSTAANIADLRTAERYAHPWFGPLDAYGWLAITSLHMGIHRRQIQAIKAALAKANH